MSYLENPELQILILHILKDNKQSTTFFSVNVIVSKIYKTMKYIYFNIYLYIVYSTHLRLLHKPKLAFNQTNILIVVK